MDNLLRSLNDISQYDSRAKANLRKYLVHTTGIDLDDEIRYQMSPKLGANGMAGLQPVEERDGMLLLAPISRRLSEGFNKYFRTAVNWALSPLKLSQHKHRHEEGLYCIEYSVFKPLPHVFRIENDLDLEVFRRKLTSYQDRASLGTSADPTTMVTQRQFDELVDIIIDTMEEHPPARISQGSSGSYFIYGPDGSRVGVFKPKDEEPYGPLSPKWSKWMHRTFFPCFFGRSCLIPNLGYISEAAASTMDKLLLTNIVPYTGVVWLKSPEFYYSYWQQGTFPPKIGSLQLFLNDYVSAADFFKIYPLPNDISTLPMTTTAGYGNREFKWSKKVILQFRHELEKLVILDYIIRNTDRGLDNWMIKLEWVEVSSSCNGQSLPTIASSPSSGGSRSTSPELAKRSFEPRLKIGAIDSGLAFPWKHPDEWRLFPFGWLFLPYSIIGQPFTTTTRNHFLPLLTSKYWWEQMVIELKAVFQIDTDFKERMWHKQLAVLKGKAFNVVEVLKLSYAGPLELTRREDLLVWDDIRSIPQTLPRGKGLRQGMLSNGGDFFEPLLTPHLPPTLPLMPYAEFDPRKNAQDWDTEAVISGLSLPASSQAISDVVADSSVLSTENTPLLNEVSGFEYNMSNKGDEQLMRVQTRKCIIERIEAVYTRGPVFTWC